MTARAPKILLAIALLAAAGVVVSSVALYHHYGASPSSFCDFGASFNCDIVNRSIYSTVLGIPVALFGILGYATLAVLATLGRMRTDLYMPLLLASVAGLGFALYLTYVEAFVLAVWCILCLSSLVLILVISVLSSWIVAGLRRA